MAIFGPKPWVNPFGKMSIFRLFLTSCFYSLEKRFFVLEYRKRYFFWPILPKKKSEEKWPFLDQNHGLTPLEIPQFFDFLIFLFLQLRKAFFRSRISLKTFSWPILAQIKPPKMATFGPKPWVNPFGKMSIFRLFELFVFIA